MAGWNLKSGSVKNLNPSEELIWALFNFVFSDSCRKRNTYKFGLIKSLLDNAFTGVQTSEGVYYTYEQIFGRFAENYWNLVVKYDLRQMRRDGKSIYSKIETILKDSVELDGVLPIIQFETIDNDKKHSLIKKVTTECKKNVVGALYEDFEGVIYSFDIREDGLTLNYPVYEFMLKYKTELEKLNYYAWAKFLEQINDDNALVKVIDKLELATPRRGNLSVYREILRCEFEEDTCFYCGRKLQNSAHVDHFIPWVFVKDDKVWNFVLSCPTCNERKKDKIPIREHLYRIECRNKKMQLINNEIVQEDYRNYSEDLLDRMWQYAKMSGIKEYRG